MYLELFEYFVNNRDVPTNTELPLNPDLLSAIYEPSSHFVEDKQFLKSKDVNNYINMGGLTLNSIGECLKLSRLFVNKSDIIFNSLHLNDFEPFHCSLLELESVLLKMMNILSSAIAKKDYYELSNNEGKYVKIKVDDAENNTEPDNKIKNESDSKTDDDHKDDDAEENEEKEKHDDSDSLDKNNMECMSWVFNEDITCSHGNNYLIIQFLISTVLIILILA